VVDWILVERAVQTVLNILYNITEIVGMTAIKVQGGMLESSDGT
jgi:hypothetical protein